MQFPSRQIPIWVISVLSSHQCRTVDNKKCQVFSYEQLNDDFTIKEHLINFSHASQAVVMEKYKKQQEHRAERAIEIFTVI